MLIVALLVTFAMPVVGAVAVVMGLLILKREKVQLTREKTLEGRQAVIAGIVLMLLGFFIEVFAFVAWPLLVRGW